VIEPGLRIYTTERARLTTVCPGKLSLCPPTELPLDPPHAAMYFTYS